MAGIVVLLPKDFGYIILTIIAYCFVNLYMQLQVNKARKKYHVSYPALYATEADTKDYKLFNCIQRGHQNSLESLPIFFVLMVLGGFKHPLICSCLGLVYTITRFFYLKGYSSGDPKGRLPIGGFNGIALLGLVIVNITFGTMLCLGKICMICTFLIVLGITIGLLFGFGVFTDGFHKIKNVFHYSQSHSYSHVVYGRSFRSPPPF